MALGLILNVTFAVITIVRFSINADVSSFMTEGSAAGESFVALNSKYATADPIQILTSLPPGSGFNTSKSLAHLAECASLISEVEGVASVSTILPADVTNETVALWPPHVVSSVTTSIVASLLLSEDERHTLMMATPCATCSGMDVARDLSARVGEVGAQVLPGGIEARLSGNPMVFATVVGMLSFVLFLIPPALLFLLLLIFYLRYACAVWLLLPLPLLLCVPLPPQPLLPPLLPVSSPLALAPDYCSRGYRLSALRARSIGNIKLTIFSIIPAIMGSLWTFGVIFGAGLQIDVVTVIVPIFVVVMGSADGLHFVMHFQEEVARTSDKVERVETTLTQVGIPMILTTISTAAGFLSLCLTGVRPIIQMGAFAALGISFAGLISFFFLPALLSKVPLDGCCPCCPCAGCKRTQAASRGGGGGGGGGGDGGGGDVETAASSAATAAHHSSPMARAVNSVLQAAVRGPRGRAAALLLSVAIAVFSAFFIPKLDIDTDQLFFFKDDHSIRTNFGLTQQIFGGATPLSGEFVFDPTGGNLTGQLADVRAAAAGLEALPGVRRIFSMADVVAEGTSEAALAIAFDPDADGSALPMGKMVASDGLRFTLFPAAFTNADVEEWQAFQADRSDVVRTLTGMPIIWGEVAKLVLRAQLESLGYAFGLVTLLLLLTYRDLVLTLIALIPLALTVALVLGFVAASGMKLNLVTAIISSIVIGVGIDCACFTPSSPQPLPLPRLLLRPRGFACGLLPPPIAHCLCPLPTAHCLLPTVYCG